ncbi:Carbamoyltransferase [Paracidovorax anthurii]|uniref:Carbamoyltransferase n=1 Tax=Paracidovorax anthurii TaxID=78229 RepID=A0A328YAV1_9BURK|nr:carbamoyltransferase [Paracidovorax anthurii]RAR70730.1 carbamoyltransferase [Paracidovorax anthurii]
MHAKGLSLNSYVLGLSCGYHDSAASLLHDGNIIAAAQEERFTRVKQDASFPKNAIQYCLREAGIDLDAVETVYYYENPDKKFDRIIQTYLNFGLRGLESFVQEVPGWFFEKRHVKRALRRDLQQLSPASSTSVPRLEYIDHHESHAAAAFLPSPFQQAAVLCVDGVGEWATTSAWLGNDNRMTPLWEIRFPHSLGLLYSAITYFCGFKVDSGEYKLMGLAPYGRPIYAQLIRDHLVDVKEDGSFWLNMDYFDYAVGNSMISEKFSQLFGGPRRQPESQITRREFDLAASIQVVLEDTLMRLARTLRKQSGMRQLCMAGGVALNCVANGKLLASGIFDHIWVQPASGDAGGALGAALAGVHLRERVPRAPRQGDSMKATLLGSSYGDTEIAAALRSLGAVFTRLEDAELCPQVANLLSQGNVVGWFQGRMEFGPRALGSRSILGDARNRDMQSVMNLKIKNRESFRPFAPMVLEEHASEWFELDRSSPYMLFVVGVQEGKRLPLNQQEQALEGIELLKCPRSEVPAVTHVDYSARVQTVGANANHRLRELLQAFHALTGCPVLVNTSFNVRGEPIVESPTNAYLCFMRTQMDYLVIGNYLMKKSDQPEWVEHSDWRKEFALD